VRLCLAPGRGGAAEVQPRACPIRGRRPKPAGNLPANCCSSAG